MILEPSVFADERIPRKLRHRGGEVDALVDALRRRTHVLMHGPSGVGKTVLSIHTACRLHRERGVPYAHIRTMGATRGAVLRAAIEAHPAGRDAVPDNTPVGDLEGELRAVVNGPYLCILDEADDLPATTIVETLLDVEDIILVVVTHDWEAWLARSAPRVQQAVNRTLQVGRFGVNALADILRARADAGLEPGVVTRTQLERIADRVDSVMSSGAISCSRYVTASSAASRSASLRLSDAPYSVARRSANACVTVTLTSMVAWSANGFGSSDIRTGIRARSGKNRPDGRPRAHWIPMHPDGGTARRGRERFYGRRRGSAMVQHPIRGAGSGSQFPGAGESINELAKHESVRRRGIFVGLALVEQPGDDIVERVSRLLPSVEALPRLIRHAQVVVRVSSHSATMTTQVNKFTPTPTPRPCRVLIVGTGPDFRISLVVHLFQFINEDFASKLRHRHVAFGCLHAEFLLLLFRQSNAEFPCLLTHTRLFGTEEQKYSSAPEQSNLGITCKKP